jgi:hypothetical protein
MMPPYKPEGFIELFTPTWRPNPARIGLWDDDADLLRLNDVLYDEEVDALVDECDGFLPGVSESLLLERMRALAAQVTGYDDTDYADGELWVSPGGDLAWCGDLHHARARRYKCAIGLTRDEWNLVRAAFAERCAYCQSRGRLQMDHVVPMSHRGPHRFDNVVPACRPCNYSKGSKSLDEWFESRPDLDEHAITRRIAAARRYVARELRTRRGDA